MVRCRSPFEGRPLRASCALGNTDPGGLAWQLPDCRLLAGYDPLPVPSGFMRTSTGWQCAPGFEGSISVSCSPASACRVDTAPAGCSPLLPCEVEEFEDVDDRFGFIEGNLSFGPAHLAGIVGELQVRDYRVFFVDHCNETIGEPLEIVAKAAVS